MTCVFHQGVLKNFRVNWDEAKPWRQMSQEEEQGEAVSEEHPLQPKCKRCMDMSTQQQILIIEIPSRGDIFSP